MRRLIFHVSWPLLSEVSGSATVFNVISRSMYFQVSQIINMFLQRPAARGWDWFSSKVDTNEDDFEFHIGMITECPNSNLPIISISAIQMKLHLIGRVTWGRSRESQTFTVKWTNKKMFLNERIYNEVKDVIRRRTSQLTQDFIFDIPLANYGTTSE